MRTSKLFIMPVLLTAIFLATNAVAAPNAANANENATTNSGTTTRAGKLADNKLKICQNREAGIKKRNQQLNKMAENMLIKFDRIATRVETYYTEKSVPAGKTVSNYEALVADIAAKKTVVETGLDKTEATYGAFKCTNDDPKGQLTQYRKDMQAVKQALKDYRTSIKNLIIAIRNANSESTGE